MAQAPKIQRYYHDAGGVMNPTDHPDLGDWMRTEDVEGVFKPDVAYMPVPRCDQCRYWGHRVDGTPHGNKGGVIAGAPMSTCEHSRDKLRYGGRENGLLWTDEDFGCVQWEAKGG